MTSGQLWLLAKMTSVKRIPIAKPTRAPTIPPRIVTRRAKHSPPLETSRCRRCGELRSVFVPLPELLLHRLFVPAPSRSPNGVSMAITAPRAQPVLGPSVVGEGIRRESPFTLAARLQPSSLDTAASDNGPRPRDAARLASSSGPSSLGCSGGSRS